MITINIVTALNCEAKPLIDYYRLSKVNKKPFDFYTGQVNSVRKQSVEMNLIVGGIGQLNTAMACGWLAAQSGLDRTIWLNVGIAGHKDNEVGRILRVCNVNDPITGFNHYPALTAKWNDDVSALMTSALPLSEYPEATLVDMEATAFFTAAGSCASSELVQSLKVVSDNQEESLERLNASLISQLIAAQIEKIVGFINEMVKLFPIQSTFHESSKLIEHLHCTVSQRQQFIELTEKLQSLKAFSKLFQDEIKQADSMKLVLQKLKQELTSIKPSLLDMTG